MKLRDLKKEGVQRAYTTIEIKSVEMTGDKRTFSGIASTPTTDRMGDIVEPGGAVFKLPIPLLWQHDSRQPIGWVTEAKVTAKGIEISGEIADVPEEGDLKNRLATAWQSIKAGLVRGLSIGFDPIEHSQIDGTWGYRYTKWEWLELSAVTIPANSDCSINAIKAADTTTRAALGLTRSRVVRLVDPPGASGISKTVPAPGGLFVAPKGNLTMKTIAERIADFKAKQAENLAKATEIVNKSVESGQTLDAEQKQLMQTLKDENAAIDEHIAMLEDHQKMLVKTATAVTGDAGSTVGKGAAASTGSSVDVGTGAIVTVKSNLPKGTGLTRIAMSIARSKGNLIQAANIAKAWKDTPHVGMIMDAMANVGSSNLTKAAVAVGDSNTSGWASQLVYYNNLASEFIELLRPKTIIGRIQNLRRVPFNIRVGATSSGSSSAWVGENAPIPASAMAFTSVTLGHAKAASLVVLTQELVDDSTPAAEGLVRDDMIKAMTQFLDQQFIDPSVALNANVSPASITNGLTPIASTGFTVAAIYTDVQALMTTFDVAELDTSDCVWVMRPGTARALSMKRTSQDIPIFPGINQNGGEWFGLPVITSNSVPTTVSGGTIIALVKASEVFFADDGGIVLDMTTEASVQMLTNPSAGAAQLVSLFQNGLVGLRAIRDINWQRRRATAVGYIDGVMVS
jgi:HK97 family phage major capsid protein/HK97 family phage prohead protease